jgi:hypothetical protein
MKKVYQKKTAFGLSFANLTNFWQNIIRLVDLILAYKAFHLN